ncbi:hypothetical protein GBA52_006548 [Prunus armeniaca]|nr:hypothetical protein GBA52_006548 [Prunus armeniaca]
MWSLSSSLAFDSQLGGPSWKFRLGRRDSTTASRSAANTSISPPTSNISTVERTKDNIVKKQALTYEEIKAEPEEQEEIETESHDKENEQQIHNPLKLPLGPDGKIIYYWMYKLHGLGQEFKCEICGDSSYFGRRAFEIHFNGECHKRGMRCLGIPKTKSFNEITSIEEAKELWKRIQERQGENLWCPDLGEEYEDEEGNIYNKKTYNDLKRQGLL